MIAGRNTNQAESQCLEASSLRSEVKRLIALRQAHPALQSRGEIKFLQKGYPLVYERVLGSERILVIINPAQQDATVPLSHGEILYTVGNDVQLSDGTAQISGCTACFIAQ